MEVLWRTGLLELYKNTHEPATPLLDISPIEVQVCSPKTCPRMFTVAFFVFAHTGTCPSVQQQKGKIYCIITQHSVIKAWT